MTWGEGKRGRLFLPGKNAVAEAEREALNCSVFQPDCEEERVAEEEISCLNCRYRRWTASSFECMRKDMTR